MNEHNEPLDDYGLDLNAVDTSRPVLKDGAHPFVITEAVKKDNKAGTGQNLMVTYKLLQDREGCKGQGDEREDVTVKAGMLLSQYMPLQQSDNPDAPDFKEGLCNWIDGVYGTKQGTRPTLAQAVANAPTRQVMVTVKIGKARDGYPPSNDVKRVKAID